VVRAEAEVAQRLRSKANAALSQVRSRPISCDGKMADVVTEDNFRADEVDFKSVCPQAAGSGGAGVAAVECEPGARPRDLQTRGSNMSSSSAGGTDTDWVVVAADEGSATSPMAATSDASLEPTKATSEPAAAPTFSNELLFELD
jgi:hypothetical protein